MKVYSPRHDLGSPTLLSITVSVYCPVNARGAWRGVVGPSVPYPVPLPVPLFILCIINHFVQSRCPVERTDTLASFLLSVLLSLYLNVSVVMCLNKPLSALFIC